MSTLKVEKIQHPNSASVALTLDTSGYLALQAGSASTPAIQGPSDPNTGIFFPAADTIAFAEGGTEVLRIDSSGRVGIGTSSPSRTLDVTGTARVSSVLTMGSWIQGTTQLDLYGDSTSSSGVRLDSSGRLGIGTTSPGYPLTVVGASSLSDWVYIGGASGARGVSSDSTARALLFAIDSSEKARIDTSGRLLVGTSSAFNNGYTDPLKSIIASSTYASGLGLGLYHFQNDSNAAFLSIGKSDNNTVGSHTAVGASKQLGGIFFDGSDGSAFKNGASIIATNDQASSWASGDCPTRLTFSTTADGASSPTERMRISNGGTTTITGGGTGTNNNFLAQNSSSARILALRDDGYTQYGTATNSPYNFGVSTSTKAMFMDSAGGFGFNSSIRASKTNIETAPTADWINNLDVVTFNYRLKNEDGTYSDEAEAELRWGVIAEDAEQVNPDFCSYDSSGKLDGFHYDRMIPVLLKAIQELKVEVADLKAQLS